MKKRLYRSRKGKKLGGVCDGLAKYLNVDPVLIRIIWVLWLCFGSFGFWVYVLAWIIIPKEPLIPIPENEGKETKTEKIIKTVLLGLTVFIMSFTYHSDKIAQAMPAPNNIVLVDNAVKNDINKSTKYVKDGEINKSVVPNRVETKSESIDLSKIIPTTPTEATFEDVSAATTNLSPVTPKEATFDDEVTDIDISKLSPGTPKEATFE